MKTFFFFFFFLGGGGGGGQVGGGGGGGGSQGGCEQRIEVFVKIKKKNWGGGGRGRVWGVRVDVIEELKSFWENSQKKNSGGGGRFGWGGGSGWM